MKDKIYYLKILLFGFKHIVKKCQKYLVTGSYIITSDLSSINRNSTMTTNLDTFSKLHVENNKIKLLCSKIIMTRVVKVTKTGSYSGENIIISSSKATYKIFDLNKE